jgi:hypothetical protein
MSKWLKVDLRVHTWNFRLKVSRAILPSTQAWAHNVLKGSAPDPNSKQGIAFVNTGAAEPHTKTTI